VKPFELTDLNRAIGPLPWKKPGHDCILNEHIIQVGESTKQMLLMLFNSVLQTSHIIPIYKGKGKAKSDPSSYRPISLIPVVSKLFEKLILSFQPNLNCLTTAFALQETVLYHIEHVYIEQNITI